MAPKTILITGATDGLGLEMARIYAAADARLILVGRRPRSELTDPLFNTHSYCQADLAKQNAAAKITAWLAEKGITSLDLLIQNAGGGYYGPLGEQQEADIARILQVNLYTPIRLSHLLAPLLTAVHGHLVFVSSVATALPTPDYAVYSASKAALEGFARSLRIEWRGQVGVQLLRPGAARTGMHLKVGAAAAGLNWERFPPAAKVAAQMVRAIRRGGRERTLGAANRLVTAAGRHGRLLLDPLLQRRHAPPLQPAENAGFPPLAVITGAADGIGRALMEQYAAAGWRLLGVDIDSAKAVATRAALQAQGAAVEFVIADLTTPAGRTNLLKALAANGPAACVVHNAGISAAGPFTTLPVAAQEAVLDLNLEAPLLLTAALLSKKLLLPQGKLIFLSSLSRYLSYPGAAVYAASKDGVAHFARSLRAVRPRGSVLTVFPGPTRTAHARRYSPDNSNESRRMLPAAVAAAIFNGSNRGAAHLIPGFSNKIMAIVGKISPPLIEWGMKKMILDKLKTGMMINSSS